MNEVLLLMKRSREMLKKGSKFYSIFNNKCPRCQEGDFLEARPYNLKKVGDIYDHCSECGLKYSKEPGFYFGAMYVSYALGVALFVTLWTSFNLFFEDIAIGLQIFIIITATILLTPYLYALSKIIWANIFFKYDRDARTKRSN